MEHFLAHIGYVIPVFTSVVHISLNFQTALRSSPLQIKEFIPGRCGRALPDETQNNCKEDLSEDVDLRSLRWTARHPPSVV